MGIPGAWKSRLGAPLFGLGLRFLTGAIADAGSGGLALAFDLGTSYSFTSASGGTFNSIGLPIVAAASWVHSLGGAQLLIRAGMLASLNYSFLTGGSNSIWSADLQLLGIGGLGFVIPSDSAPKWLLGVDVLFGHGAGATATFGRAL